MTTKGLQHVFTIAVVLHTKNYCMFVSSLQVNSSTLIRIKCNIDLTAAPLDQAFLLCVYTSPIRSLL